MTNFGAVLLLAISITFSSFQAHANPFTCVNLFRPGWSQKVDFKSIEATLAEGRIQSIMTVPEYLQSQGKVVNLAAGTKPAFVITFENGVRGIYKPINSRTTEGSAKGEVAAYKLSERLGLHLVPPTLLRSFNSHKELQGTRGSIQYFVETKVDLLSTPDYIREVSQDQWNNTNLLHYLLGQWDRHPGNFLVDNTGRLVVIDNGAMASSVQWKLGDYPWVKRGQNPTRSLYVDELFPFENPTAKLHNPSKQEVATHIGDYLNRTQLNVLVERQIPRMPNRDLIYTLWNNEVYIQRFGALKKFDITELPDSTVEKLRTLKPKELHKLLEGLISLEKSEEIISRLKLIKARFFQ